jgi:hypothetical protein
MIFYKNINIIFFYIILIYYCFTVNSTSDNLLDHNNNNTALPNNFFQNEFILLNIGGICSKDGWYNINANNIT